MYTQFAVDLLRLLRCPHGSGRLVATSDERAIVDGVVRCECCAREYRVSQGILSLVDASALHPEGANEMGIRDRDTAGYDAEIARIGKVDDAETIPTMQELGPLGSTTVLELGCGTGRYTLRMLPECGALLATDFSLGSLLALARKLPDGDPRIGLVQADITRLTIAEHAFDRVLSTLVSNLPSAVQREAMYRLAARAVSDGGRFVFSTHNYGPRERLYRAPVEGPYHPDYPVFRRLFTPREILSEAGPHFARVKCRHVQIALPLTRRFPFPIVAFSRMAERVPGLRRLAGILLFSAERGATASGSPREHLRRPVVSPGTSPLAPCP
jgi:SAM-dependent methyltransferase